MSRTVTSLCLAAAAVYGAAGLSPVPAEAGLCDGRSDATAALNAMLAAGGQVQLPAGTCLISGSLRIPSGTAVSGSGIGRTIIKASPTPEYPVIAIGSTRGGASNVDLSGLTVDANGTRMIEGPSDGVLAFLGSSKIRIHDIEVHGAGANGIKVVGTDIEVSDNIAHDNFANGLYTVGRQRAGAILPSMNIRFLRNRVMHNSLGGVPPARSWDGIAVDPATVNCVVQGNTIIGNDIILFDNGKFGTSSDGHQVLDNTIVDSVSNGIGVDGYINNFRVVGNRMQHTRGFGIVVNGPVSHGEIGHNTILGTTKPGIYIGNYIRLPGTPTGIDVSGNTIDPGLTAGSSPSIAVHGGAVNVRVVGNQLNDHGVDVRGSGSGVVVQGNR